MEKNQFKRILSFHQINFSFLSSFQTSAAINQLALECLKEYKSLYPSLHSEIIEKYYYDVTKRVITICQSTCLF